MKKYIKNREENQENQENQENSEKYSFYFANQCVCLFPPLPLMAGVILLPSGPWLTSDHISHPLAKQKGASAMRF